MGSVTSVPLRTLIAFTLQISDNLAAELLTKELGLRTVGSGTTAAGTAATIAVMSRLSVPTAGIVMVDGSGLDRGNRLTCRALAAVAARAREPGSRSLAGLLPAAGAGTSMQGRVAAKGGYLTDVIGLAGLLDGERDYEFAFLANSRLSPRPIDDIDGFAEALAAVPAFDASGLVPKPEPPRLPVAAIRS
jgi:D-alanyl-D-alanine carboxypeptidase/D-alanyl-D-alanine-endopeptidase (penicillin-binding protein 4)